MVEEPAKKGGARLQLRHNDSDQARVGDAVEG